MKLLVATGLYPPDMGGPATYSKLLFDGLPQYNVEVDVVSFGTVRHLPMGLRHLVYLIKLLARSSRVDLIYAQDTVSVGVPAAIAAFLTGRELWVRVPGDYAWEQGMQRFGVSDPLDIFVKKNGYPFPVRVMKLMQRWVVRRARRVIVPSNYVARVVTQWGVAGQNIRVIYSSVESIHSLETKEAARARLGLSGRVIVSSGRLVPWKGFSTLIDAFVNLKKEFSDVVLVIVGGGPLEKELKVHALKCGVADAVHFPGQLPQAELFAYIRAGDVFVLNTAYEGLSHQLIEVMMIGTPIVTTPVGGNPELITDKEEGILVPYNDRDALAMALRKLFTDALFAERLSRSAKKRSEKFGKENAVAVLCNEFKAMGYLA